PLRTKPAGLADQSRARVFLVDDHDLMRAGARGVLGEAVDIVGEADDVPAAIELIREREPDLVLVDVRMPGGGGLAVVKAVKATHPHIHFLALSAYDKPTDVIPMIRAGALGYLTKDVHREDFVPQVITAATGAIVYSPKLADLIRTALGPEGPDVVDPRVDLLTPRELEVVSLVSRALTNKEIARRLSTSPKTVESQLRSVFRKLQLTNRQEVVIWASGRGLAATS
ncbi:MAG: response regulator, partial [Acidimicrobiia bacterium]